MLLIAYRTLLRSRLARKLTWYKLLAPIRSEYVTVPIYFDSDSKPVQIEIKAYVVKGMATPIILGNDFADQYSISLIREGPESFLMFGNTGRKTKVESSVSTPVKDKNSHTFKVRILPNLACLISKFKPYKHIKKLRKKLG